MLADDQRSPTGSATATAGPPDVASLNANQRARRGRIVDAALAMMLEQDHSAIQMKAVSRAAGVALGTTYRYFPSKDQLLAEALAAWAERFPRLDGRQPGGRSVDRLKAVYRRAARSFEPNPTMYTAMAMLETSRDPIAAETFDRFARRNRDVFTRAIPRVAQPRRDHIVLVMSSVLDNQLRHWSLGSIPVTEVYRSLDITAELLLGD